MELLPSNATTVTHFSSFLAASIRDFPIYRKIMRGNVDVLEVNAPERYVRRWLKQWQHTDPNADAAQLTDILAAAILDPSLNGLGLVASALWAMQDKRFVDAAELSERAYAMDQHETFAQRLFLAAAEQSQTLRLKVDDWLEDRFCSNPFTDVEVIGSGDVYTCCAAWLPASIGSARDPKRADYWQGTRATEIRRSVLDGDFGYCSRLSCPKIAGRTLPRRIDVTEPAMCAAIKSHGRARLPPPSRVLLSYDTSCNLSCPSCRLQLISAKQSDVNALDVFFDDRIAPLLDSAKHIKITGSGDPFGSRHFRHVIAKLTANPANAARLQLHSNGVLFDKRAWESLKLNGHVSSVWVSIDAAEPATYAKLRRGGSFPRLLRNLEFLGNLRSDGKISSLRLDFVVQAENFRQMPDFVDLAKRIGADGVHFLMLRNWGTYSEKDYRTKAVAFEGHAEFEDLLAILADDCFGAKGVDLGNLGPLRQRALSAAVTITVPGKVQAKAPIAKAIAFFGVPRTGSNYLFECLRAYGGLMVLNEIFNPRAAYGLDDYPEILRPHFSALKQTDYSGESDDRLVRHIADYPADTVAQIRSVATRGNFAAVAFQIFPKQINDAVLCDDILADPGIQKVILVRPMLETYISYRKAQETNSWKNVDTTGLRPILDTDHFDGWMTQTKRWYDMLQTAMIATGQSFGWLSYADVTRGTKDQCSQRIDNMFKGIGVEILKVADPVPKLARQDRTLHVFERIANGADFEQDLKKRDLLKASLMLPQRLKR